nr:WecB/TagA/CpsF family glycosyltransferase [Maliibacterium massiliense]
MLNYFNKLYRGTKQAFFAEVSQALERQEKQFIVTANPETLMLGRENLAFDAVLQKNTTTIVPDGIGVIKAGKMLGMSLHERITGVDLAGYLLDEAERLQKRVFLYGAKEEVIRALETRITQTHPAILLCGCYNGYDHNDAQVMQEALDQRADIIMVALGIPRQELLIDAYFAKATKGVFIGVGGSFDVLSGAKKRAPSLWVKCNLEWLYRILKEPQRIKRFYRSNVKFIHVIRRMKKDGTRYDA